MHINCPSNLAFCGARTRFDSTNQRPHPWRFLCAAKASKLSGIKDHFSDASWSPSSLGWWFLWVWEFFVGETLSEIWRTEGGWLVNLFGWLLGCFGWLDHLQLQLLQKRRNAIKNKEEQYMMFWWCHFLRLLICCWLGTVDDTGSAVDKLWSYSTCSPEQNTYRQYKVGPYNPVINGVTWGP